MHSFSSYKLPDIPQEIWTAWERCGPGWMSYPLQSSKWARVLADNAGPGDEMFLLAGRDDARYLGFWPYRLETARSGKLLPVMLCRPWDHEGDLWARVAPEADPDFVTRFIEAFHHGLPTWHKMQTGLIPEATSFESKFEGYLAANALNYVVETRRHAEIRDWQSFDEFLASVSPKWRSQYRRLTRKDVQTGRIRIQHLTEFSEATLDSTRRRIMDIYKESWKTASRDPDHNLLVPRVYGMFRALTDAFARDGGLHVVIASVGGDDAAFCVGLSQHDTYCSLQTAFKSKYRTASVGFLAQMAQFCHTIERGYRTNDLLANQPYKAVFTDRRAVFSVYTVFNANRMGALAYHVASLKRRLMGRHVTRMARGS